MHPDHFFDLVPLKYAISFNAYPRLPLFLPPGGADMLEALAEALHENGRFWSSAYEVHTFDPEIGVDVAGMRVSMAPSHHFIPAWAMAFEPAESPGRRFAYTSDTSMTETVIDHVRGADLLMAEASVMKQDKPAPEQGHLTPRDAGCLARVAGAKRLVITHYPVAASSAILSEAAAGFGAPCDLAVEGARVII
jgi:ribonuclease BN (tRNA processing enzyme)